MRESGESLSASSLTSSLRIQTSAPIDAVFPYIPIHGKFPFMAKWSAWELGNSCREIKYKTKQNKRSHTPTHIRILMTHVHHHPPRYQSCSSFRLHSSSSLLHASRCTDSVKSLESRQIGTPPSVADLVLCRPFFVVCTLHYFLTC